MSTLRAALAEFIQQASREAYTAGGIRYNAVPTLELRDLLAAHPAPDEAGEAAVCGCPDSRDCCEADADLTPITGGLADAETVRDAGRLSENEAGEAYYREHGWGGCAGGAWSGLPPAVRDGWEHAATLAARLAAVTADRDEAREAAKLHEHGYCEHSIEHNERLARRLTDAEAEVESLREQLDEHRAHYVDPHEYAALRAQVAAVAALTGQWGTHVAASFRAVLTNPSETLRARDERVWAEGWQAGWHDRTSTDPVGTANPYVKEG